MTGVQYRPLDGQLARLESGLHEEGAEKLSLDSIDPVMRDLFRMHEQGLRPHSGAEESLLLPRLKRFLADVAAWVEAEPTAPELAVAPLIESWTVVRKAGCAALVGRTTAHPLLREGARTLTSPLLRLAPEQGWARCWSRYYRLGRQDRTIYDQLVAEGLFSRQKTPVVRLMGAVGA